MALNSPAAVTSTPADKSNSPPIINIPTATATIPIVDDWYSTVKNDGAERNDGATTKKKMRITIAATRAPTSGRASSRLDRPSFTRFEASDGAPAAGGVLTV